MGNRRRTSTAEDFMDLVALLPWWAGVGLAVASYLLFAGVASEGGPPIAPGSVGSGVVGTVVAAFSKVLQYLVPLLCLAGAALSAWRRRERSDLLARATGADTSVEVSRMTWQQFELLVGEAFRQQGYKVAELGGAGPDGGVDLVLIKNGARYLVQCKQWRAFKVGVGVVRELFGVMAAQQAAGGYLVTSGRLTEEAKAFAAGKNITLIDGAGLGKFLRSGQQGATTNESFGGRSTPAEPTSSPAQVEDQTGCSSNAETVPTCPRCSKAMVRRTARQGARAGRQFWGCSDYPGCRGAIAIDH
jgi:restriction system protein